jgi:hypothetical protein
MDFFQSHTVPSRCYLTFFHIPERSIALVKRLAGSPKGAEIDPNLPHANKSVTQGSTHSYIHWWTSFSRTKLCPSRCSYLLPFSRTFNCTSKTTGWFTKGAEIDPTCPTLTKCYSKVAHAFLYTLMDSRQTVPKPLLSYLLPFSRTFNCTKKRLAGSQRAEIDQPAC